MLPVRHAARPRAGLLFYGHNFDSKRRARHQAHRQLHRRSEPHGTIHTYLRGSEKGIDVRIALDVIRLAVRNEYDVAVVFSQDQDLSEVADELRLISKLVGRWIRIACAYPVSPTRKNNRGINHSEWIQVDRKMYDASLDPTDYR